MIKQAIVLMTAVALTGCYQAVDQAAQEQAAADAQAQELSQTQAAWTQAVSRVTTVRGVLGQADFDRAKQELDVVYRHLYGVVTASDLTPELRTRITRIFPTLIQLQAKVDARDKDSAVLADRLDDMLRDTTAYMVSSGWLRGGGAGRGLPEQQPKEQRPKEERDPDRPWLDNPLQQNRNTPERNESQPTK